MKNISYLLSLLLVFSYVSFADEEVKEAPKESEEVAEDVAEEVMDELKISRGNANMNLRALLDWGIIQKELRIGERKEFFKAEKDIIELARIITVERRKREIEPMLKALNHIQELDSQKSEDHKEFKKVTGDLLSFTKKANGIMEKFTKSDKNWFYKLIMRV